VCRLEWKIVSGQGGALGGEADREKRGLKVGVGVIEILAGKTEVERRNSHEKKAICPQGEPVTREVRHVSGGGKFDVERAIKGLGRMGRGVVREGRENYPSQGNKK